MFDDETHVDHSGLSAPQKSVIEKAFGESKEPARDIIEYFRNYLCSQARCKALTYNFLKYACKVKGCSYLMKYEQDTFGQIHKIYCSGIHAHQRNETDGDERGSSGPQKSSVEKAFNQKNKSARKIIELFRNERSLIHDESELKEFPLDSKRRQSNNYIQSYKKNGQIYNPTPHNLESWCKSQCWNIKKKSMTETSFKTSTFTPRLQIMRSRIIHFPIFFMILNAII